MLKASQCLKFIILDNSSPMSPQDDSLFTKYIFDATRPSLDIGWRMSGSAIALESPAPLTLADLLLSLARRTRLSTMGSGLEFRVV